MAQRDFSYESRKQLVEKHEQKLFNQCNLDARIYAVAIAGYSYENINVNEKLEKLLEKFHNESPMDFIKRTPFSEVLRICIPSKENREKYSLIVNKSNQFQYSAGYYRRSVRSKDYSFVIERNLRLLHDYYLFRLYKSSLSQYLKNELDEEELDLKMHTSMYYGSGAIVNLDMLIAAELDWDLKNGGPGELHKTIKDIIIEQNNTNTISVPVIRGILKSDDFELHDLLGKLLLAARLQEGLRQAICENMDSGTTQAFITLFDVVKSNNLIRFSSVKRAVATWIGIFNEKAPDRISNKTLDLMDKCLKDKKARDSMIKSDDSMELITGLWATSFYEAKDAVNCIMSIFNEGKRNQLLVVSYYISSLYDKSLYSEPVESIIEKYGSDLEVAAAFFPVYLDNYNTFNSYWFRQDNPQKSSYNSYPVTLPKIWFNGNIEKARVHTKILYDLYQKLGKSKKPKVFDNCAFPWNSVSISKQNIAMRLCVMAVTIPSSVPKEITYEMIKNADSLGSSVMKRVLKVREDKEDRDFAIQVLNNKPLMETAAKLLQELSLTDKEYIYIESLLHYKDSRLRSIACELIADRSDKDFKTSIERLLNAKSEDERFAGLNFINRLKKQDKELGHKNVDWKAFENSVSKIPAPTQKEVLFINSIFDYQDNNQKSKKYAASIEELYNEKDVSQIKVNQIKIDSKLTDKIAACNKNQLISILNEFDKLMISHKDDQYKDYRGNEHLLGEKNNFSKFGTIGFASFNSEDAKRPIDMLPFADLWMSFYNDYIKSPEVLIQLFILTKLHCHKNNILKKFISSSDNEINPKILNIEKILFGKLCQVNPGEFEYFCQSPKSYRESAFFTVAEILIKSVCDKEYLKKLRYEYYYKLLTKVQSDDFWYKEDSRYYEKGIERMSLGPVTAFRSLENIFNSCEKNNDIEIKSDEDFIKWFNLLYALETHVSYAERTSGPSRASKIDRYNSEFLNILKPEDFFRAYKLNLINLNTVYYSIIRIRSLSKSLDQKSFYEAEDKDLFNIYMNIHDTILENELKRGEEESSCSNYVSSITTLYGAENVFRLIQGLGKSSLQRGLSRYSYYSSNNSRSYNFSYLISVSKPSKEDNAEAIKKLIEKYKIPQEKLFDLGMYNTEWLPLLSEALSIPSLESGCFYFIAHMKESWGDRRDTKGIAKFTPLTVEELGKGAFDLNWFTEVYKELGQEIFDKLYLSAKYITDGTRHARARKFADAALGRVSQEELEAEIKRARNKDLMMSYPLLPIKEKGEKFNKKILHRYEFIQQFKKESRQFGAQRRQSEGEAVEIALENLSRSAGYTDVNRLNLNMESALIDTVKQVFDWGKISAGKEPVYEIHIAINDDGAPSLQCRKEASEKILKSIPAPVKKSEEYEYINDVYKRLKLQHQRTRLMFENFMTEQVIISAGEAAALLKNPVVNPIVSKLVFISNDNNSGLISETKGKIYFTDWENHKKAISKNTEIRVAHPYDLYSANIWHKWQKYIFDNKIVQPFKQVFRELYLKLEEELDTDKSYMFAGNQIQPKKAAASLKSRRWIADYESGLQKVFYKQNLIAEIYAQTDWFSPADIECPALEYVSFSPRRYEYNKSKPLIIKDIDCIIYSEIMRDVDLAVSVAHAGAVDPETSHSTMEMRRAICDFTLPLFNIDNVTFEKNFAFIKGSRGEYRVHLGSGLIHKSAGGTINIVSVHSQQRGRLFLPFVDEDPKTAEVISKILMLARDQNIKDPYILDQINTVL